MIWNPFAQTSKYCLGIDIGAAFIKIVELRNRRKESELKNYGGIKVNEVYSSFKKNIITAENAEVAEIINTILNEMNTKTKSAVFSLPDYFCFFITFSLPDMSKNEIPEAVKYEAPFHIPLPLHKVVLDWQIVERYDKGKEKRPIKILLAAVPNEIMEKYKEIAVLSGLELKAVEAEVFGLARALVKTGELTAIVDVGFESTTCGIVDKNVLKMAYSFGSGSKELSDSFCNINAVQGQEKANEKEIKIAAKDNLPLVLEQILKETKRALDDFQKSGGKEIQNLILSGGAALIPGLKECFADNLGFSNLKIEIANPFIGLAVPPVLETNLKRMGPSYAVSVGAALRGIK